MNAIWALACKDIKLRLRDKGGFFFTFVFPIAFALFFGSIFGGTGGGGGGGDSPGIKVVLIDDDNTDSSRSFLKTLKDASELDATVSTDLAGSESRVQNGDAVALIRIMKGYGAGQENLFWRGGQQSTIEVATDPSKKAEIGMLQGVLQKYAYSGMGKAFTDPKTSRKQIDSVRKQIAGSKDISVTDRLMFTTFFDAMDHFMGGLDEREKRDAASGDAKTEGGFSFEPVKITSRDLFRPRKNDFPTNAFTWTFPQGIVWGLMGAALGFAASLLEEKTAGTYGRLVASPLPTWGVLAGKGLACFLTMMAVTCLMIVFSMLVCKVTVANWWVLGVAVVTVSLGFVGIMTIVATLAKSERAAQGGGWAVMMVLAFIGGAAVPSAVMPAWMQNVSQLSPMYWSIKAFDFGLWRPVPEFSLTHPATYSMWAIPAAIMLAIAVVGFVLGIVSVRRP
jgi:ABC-2 type transport system permease protein